MIKPYFNRFFGFTIGLSLLQQCIVASSSYWLVETTKALEGNEPFLLLLVTYVSSLLLPYIPGATALICLQRWINESQRSFLQNNGEKLFGKIGVWSSSEHRSRKLPLLVKEGPNWIENTCQWIYGITDSFLNFSLSIITLAILINAELLIAFGVGVACSSLLIFLPRQKIAMLAEGLESNRAALTHSTQNIWDNLLIGNKVNAGAWRNNFLVKFLDFNRSSMKFERLNQLLSVSLAFMSNAPIFIYFFYFIQKPGTTNVEILALIVLLPRVFQIVNSSHFFLWQLMQAGAIKSRERFIEAELSNLDVATPFDRISFEKLNVTSSDGNKTIDPKSLTEKNLPTAGRLTIRGENGAGKSSYLMHLKQILGESALYLPAKHELVLEGEPIQGSTGQQLKAMLEKISKIPKLPVLLLDEWDANLDATNTKLISDLLDSIAKQSVVIEVRNKG